MKALGCRAHDPIASLRVEQGRHPFKPAQIRRHDRRRTRRMPGYHH